MGQTPWCSCLIIADMQTSLDRPSLSGTKNDAQWQQWIAKGHAHDDRLRQRVRLILVSMASLIAVALAVALTVR